MVVGAISKTNVSIRGEYVFINSPSPIPRLATVTTLVVLIATLEYPLIFYLTLH